MLIFFSQEASRYSDQYSTLFQIKQFQSFSDWENEKIKPSAFIVEGNDATYVISILNNIRGDSELYTALSFLTEYVGELASSLSDGLLPQPESLQQEIIRFAEFDGSYRNNDLSLYHHGRLIKYMWLRPDFILQPIHEWQRTRFYYYPLLESLSRDKFDTFEMLSNLANAKMLEPVELIDRQKECTYCRSSHLSFVDVCPNCQAIDIELQASLHCFTCGCVDVQEKFLREGTLVCPKCQTQLRHIGSDYDRPIENHACRSCNYTFIDGDVLVRCAMCQKEMAPIDLVSNKIQSWRLSDRGRLIAIRSEDFDIGTCFGQIDFISCELFLHDLDWLLVMSRRYPDVNFSLFGIYFVNLTELLEQLGHTRLLLMLESFAERLRKLLRTPDLSTRTSENMLWILLPNTDENGLDGFQKRVEHNIKLLLEDSEMKLDYRFLCVPSTHIPGKETAELLLARLRGELL